jgi:polyferredoxin
VNIKVEAVAQVQSSECINCNLCAFGALQELAGRLGRAIFRKRLTVPAVVDRLARYLKYVVLVAIVALSAITGQLIIRPYDPWAAYHHILNVELLTGFLVGLILLVVSLVGSVLYDRFFCKYLCPMGGFLGLINRAGWFRVKRYDATCTHCHACDKACPVNIKVEAVAQVQSSECINCNLCVAACPAKDTLVIAGPGTAKRGVSPTVVLLITLGIFAAVVGVTTATGGFEWTAKPLAATVATGTGESGAAAATLNPDDIKGSDTFKQVADLTGIAEGAFVEKFVLQKGDFAKPIKDASHREGSGFDVEAVR